jgi:hypothetical protein
VSFGLALLGANPIFTGYEEGRKAPNSVPSSSPKEERSEEGNSMSGIYLYERLCEYHRIFEQRVQTLFPGFQCMEMVIFSQDYSKKEVEHDNH